MAATTIGNFTERVGARATEIRPARAVLSLLALPFYIVGFLVGLVIVSVVWCAAAAQVGISDARSVRRASETVTTDGAG